MGLDAVIEAVRDRERTLTVYNPTDGLVEELRAFLVDLNVSVHAAETPSGRPEDLAVLTMEGDVLATVPGGRLRSLLADVPAGPGGLGIDDTEYRQLLQHLKETTFTSYDTARMRGASREVEERAFRVARGSIVVGFQRPALLERERETYAGLVDRGLDVTVLTTPDGPVPEVRGATVDAVDDDELRDHWFVVFDGGGEPDQACALLAQERSPDEYYGFWTYDAAVVDRIRDALSERFDRAVP